MRRLSLVFACAAALAACGPTGAANTVVAILATGEARAAPDIAEVTGGIVTRAPTAKEALERQAAKMTAITTALADAVKTEDMQTVRIGLDADYDWTSKGRRLRGYVASNIVTFTVRDLNKVGAVLDAIVADGGNTVDGVTFKLDSEIAVEAKAREDAMAQADGRAKAYAAATGLKIQRIVSIREAGATLDPIGPMPPAAAPVFAQDAARAEAAAATPALPGMRTRQISLTVNYEMGR